MVLSPGVSVQINQVVLFKQIIQAPNKYAEFWAGSIQTWLIFHYDLKPGFFARLRRNIDMTSGLNIALPIINVLLGNVWQMNPSCAWVHPIASGWSDSQPLNEPVTPTSCVRSNCQLLFFFQSTPMRTASRSGWRWTWAEPGRRWSPADWQNF